MYKYDKDKIKNSLTIEQVHDLVGELGGEPHPVQNGMFVSATICHNHPGEGSHKLYYYNNTHLFKCFTECNDTFDIYELVKRQKNLSQEYKSYYAADGTLGIREWELYDAVEFVAIYFGFSSEAMNFEGFNNQPLEDWKFFDSYLKDGKIKSQKVELKIYDDKILSNLQHCHIPSWEAEGITYDVIKNKNICYDPKNHGIVIPHYDVNNNLIGIRERTLIKEQEDFGKYKPAILNGQMYNHPLGFNLFNLNNSKDNIKLMKKAIVTEGEKSCFLYASYFGEDNDISVACCGSSLINYQVDLLLSLGVSEIIVAFDRQFKEIGDKEYKNWTKKLKEIYNKYSSKVLISFIFDNQGLLEYKDSPLDRGKDIFLELFKNRIYLE